jgi:hypothetical protein
MKVTHYLKGSDLVMVKERLMGLLTGMRYCQPEAVMGRYLD